MHGSCIYGKDASQTRTASPLRCHENIQVTQVDFIWTSFVGLLPQFRPGSFYKTRLDRCGCSCHSWNLSQGYFGRCESLVPAVLNCCGCFSQHFCAQGSYGKVYLAKDRLSVTVVVANTLLATIFKSERGFIVHLLFVFFLVA